jgi:hypothetical protein
MKLWEGLAIVGVGLVATTLLAPREVEVLVRDSTRALLRRLHAKD